MSAKREQQSRAGFQPAGEKGNISEPPIPLPKNVKSSLRPVGMGLLIFLLTFAVYWPALHGDYLWDDGVMLTENRLVQKSDGLKDIWFSTKPHDYLPITLTSFWLEWRLWKLNSTGYHATNVALHALGAILLWRVLRRLKIPGAWLAAAVFAVHPVCVPSVAWIAERKNVLSLVFYLLSILCYLRDDEQCQVSGVRCQEKESRFTFHVSCWYFLSLLAFLLALLSKASVVMLPFVFLGLAAWRLGKIIKRDLIRTIPFFAFSFILGLVTIWFQKHRAIAGGSTDDFLTRIVGGGWSVWFYLWKALAPINLTMIYPRWEISPASPLPYLPWLLWLALFFALWRFRRTWARPILFGLGYFFITLAPVLGVFNMSFFMHARVADHLQYLALIGIVVLVVSGGTWAAQQKFTSHFSKVEFRAGAAALFILPFCFLTWQRAHAFANSENLWRDNVQKNPKAWGAHNNLGLAVAAQGNTEEAMQHYRASIRAKPDYANAHNNLGLALHSQKKFTEALEHYAAALQSEPKFADVHNNLGNVLMEQGKLDEAVASYHTALKYKPAFVFTHNNLGYALYRQKKYDEAIARYSIALQLDPHYTIARNNLGRSLVAKGRFAEGIPHFQTVLTSDPNNVEARYHLANALSDLGKLDEAIVEFRRALQLRPENVEVHNGLGITLGMKGDFENAALHFNESLRLQPTNVMALANLGNVFAQQGKLDDAIEKYEAALLVDPADSSTHGNLGTALFQKKRFEEAAQHYSLALRGEPNHPQFHFQHGLALSGAGNKKAAAEAFREALRLKPDFAEAQKRLNALPASIKQ